MDGITITRWSLGISLTLALSVVAAAFTLVWNRTLTRGDTQVQLVAGVTGLDARVTGLESEVREMRKEIGGLRAEVGGLRVEVGGLREGISELADLIRKREPPTSPGR